MSNMSDLSIALKSTEKSCTFSLSDTPLIRNVYVYPDRKKKKKKDTPLISLEPNSSDMLPTQN